MNKTLNSGSFAGYSLRHAFLHHSGCGVRLSRNNLCSTEIHLSPLTPVESLPGQRTSLWKHGDKEHFSSWINRLHVHRLLLCFKRCSSFLIFSDCLVLHTLHKSFARIWTLWWCIRSASKISFLSELCILDKCTSWCHQECIHCCGKSNLYF